MKIQPMFSALAFSAACLAQASAASYVYDFNAQLGNNANNSAITTANWSGNGSWQTRAYDGYAFATLTHNSETAGTPDVRTRSTDFSSVLSATDTALTLDLKVRIAGQSTYAVASGTSMAAPYVAGIAALTASADKTLQGEALRQQLLANALPIDAPHDRVGAGLARFVA